MVCSTLSDLGIGIIVYYAMTMVPVVLLIPVVLVERYIFRGWLGERHAWRNTIIINLISTALGYYGPVIGLSPLIPIESWVSRRFPEMALYYGDPPEALRLFVMLGIIATCLTSVVVEGIALMFLVEGRDFPPIHKLWLVTLVANVASYITIVVLVSGGWAILTMI